MRQDNARIPGTQITVTINDLTRVIDLCDEHRLALVAPLATVLSKYGHPPSRPAIIKRPYSKGEAGEFPCTFPDCGKVYRHKSTLRTHVKDGHAMTLAELYKAHGRGAVQQVEPPSAGEYYCPECGAMFTRPQGLGMHRSKVHGVHRPPAPG